MRLLYLGENDLKTYDKWELVSCPSCKALFWNAEAPRVQTNQESKQFSLCCQRGRVRLPPVREPPSPFLELLESPSFKPHIRIANSLLDFPSMGAKIDKSVTGYGHEKISMTPSSNACLVLEKPQKSLEGLLQTICNVDTDKTLRTRDWTERPLPPKMLRYARTDTQYLLWIADVLAAELKELKKYDECIRRCNKVCLTLYAKGQEDFKLANREQYDCRERAWKLCIWRDLMARIHDESREFVLSNEVMLEFARKVPTTYDVFKSTADQQRGGKIDEVSVIFLCHYDDYFNQIMSDKSVALETAFPLILQNGKQTSKVSQIPIRKPDVAVYESDGTLKFRCNHGKGQWYLKMGLAEQTQIHGEYALQLKTETLGGPEKVEKKKDLCNSCGKEGIELNRHRIVPPSYRKYFTETLKMDQSRDMVWLCQKCQKIALEAGERYKKTMSSRYEVSQPSHQKMVEAKEHVNIRRAAAALLDRPTIPESRREEYMEIVERHYGRSNLSREDLEGVRKIGLMSSKEEKNETSVEKQIIDNLLKNSGEDGVKRFCEEWRQQFVNDLHPTNLPSEWGM
ncbi:protein RRP6-like 3 [Brassica napus]|uniref:protein RRP6-like 3 n=1 Tax=Brassica napus TaxID=3708 RepID=UPI0020787F0D|nr:protein RRP6-like 3 [Brassica napus]